MERPESTNTATHRPVADAERQIFLRGYESGYVFRKDMRFKPDSSLSWFDQVLDLERRGKPTTVAAHDLAIAAKARADARNWTPQREPVAEPPGDWSDMADDIPF